MLLLLVLLFCSELCAISSASSAGILKQVKPDFHYSCFSLGFFFHFLSFSSQIQMQHHLFMLENLLNRLFEHRDYIKLCWHFSSWQFEEKCSLALCFIFRALMVSDNKKNLNTKMAHVTIYRRNVLIWNHFKKYKYWIAIFFYFIANDYRSLGLLKLPDAYAEICIVEEFLLTSHLLMPFWFDRFLSESKTHSENNTNRFVWVCVRVCVHIYVSTLCTEVHIYIGKHANACRKSLAHSNKMPQMKEKIQVMA